MTKDLLKDTVDRLKENSETGELGPLTLLMSEAGGDLRLVSAERALKVLAALEEEPGLNAMIRYLAHHPSSHVRSKIALLLGRARPDVQRVRSHLATSNGRLRANAIESLWGASTPEALDLFREAARDAFPRAAVNALMGLAKAGEAEAYKTLTRWASGEDESRRPGALWAIGELNKNPLPQWRQNRPQREDPPQGQTPGFAEEALSVRPGPQQALIPDASAALLKASASVLEEMCFTEGRPAAETVSMPAPSITAQVEFRGYWTGRCVVQMPDTCARMLAANFAGILRPAAVEMQSVIELLCEFVNMICGGTIARLNCPGITVLAPPHLLWEWPRLYEEAPEGELWMDAAGEPIRLGFRAHSA